MSVDEIIEAIDKLSVLELVDLKDKLQDKYGVSAAAPMMAMAAGPAAAAEEVEEQTEFKVTIETVTEKVPVIKAVREVTNLGLKEAKELVEAAPGAVVAEAVAKEEAESIKAKIEAAGATVKVS